MDGTRNNSNTSKSPRPTKSVEPEQPDDDVEMASVGAPASRALRPVDVGALSNTAQLNASLNAVRAAHDTYARCSWPGCCVVFGELDGETGLPHVSYECCTGASVTPPEQAPAEVHARALEAAQPCNLCHKHAHYKHDAETGQQLLGSRAHRPGGDGHWSGSDCNCCIRRGHAEYTGKRAAPPPRCVECTDGTLTGTLTGWVGKAGTAYEHRAVSAMATSIGSLNRTLAEGEEAGHSQQRDEATAAGYARAMARRAAEVAAAATGTGEWETASAYVDGTAVDGTAVAWYDGPTIDANADWHSDEGGHKAVWNEFVRLRDEHRAALMRTAVRLGAWPEERNDPQSTETRLAFLVHAATLKAQAKAEAEAEAKAQAKAQRERAKLVEAAKAEAATELHAQFAHERQQSEARHAAA
ncbi:MAG: hypothetical protein ACKVI4_18100, partial [Actinomycetales bacterium]